jgi:hypothetical protein
MYGLIALLLALSIVAPPAQLRTGGGWHVGAARLPDAGCARCLQTESWASTIPYRDQPNDFPERTMKLLPPAGVIIKVSRSWQPSEPAWALRVHPLRILRSTIHSNFEGNPTHGRVSVWMGSTWRAGSWVSVYIYF